VSLVELGYQDARLELAYDWMARTVTGEGMAPQSDKSSARRYYAYKCGPNFACGANSNLPCAWGAVKVMLAFAKWPAERRTPLIEQAIQTGVDFLLSGDPTLGEYPTHDGAPPSRDWHKFGFPVFYITDYLQVAEALIELGYGSDPRMQRTLEGILEKQDKQGRWALEYNYQGKTWVDAGAPRQPNKWVTLRALRVLKRAF
jgi:hypothetical protein